MEVCRCSDANAEESISWLNDCPRTRLVDESHFMIDLIRCEKCDRPWVRVFYELIDWKDGEDSQARNFIPLSEDQYKAILDHGENTDEQFLDLIGATGPYLTYSYPQSGERIYIWKEGPVFHYMHD
jgi:hypothetical protein